MLYFLIFESRDLRKITRLQRASLLDLQCRFDWCTACILLAKMDWASLSIAQNPILITGSVLLCYCVKKCFFPSSKWRSPFAEDSRTPLTPLEIDQTKRDEVLKRGKLLIAIQSIWIAANLRLLHFCTLTFQRLLSGSQTRRSGTL